MIDVAKNKWRERRLSQNVNKLQISSSLVARIHCLACLTPNPLSPSHPCPRISHPRTSHPSECINQTAGLWRVFWEDKMPTHAPK